MTKYCAQEYRSRFYITDSTMDEIDAASALILPEIHEVIEDFYEEMMSHPTFAAYFSSEEHVEHLKQLHEKYWTSFWSKKVDEEYIADRERIGDVHARIGLPLDLYYDGVVLFTHLFKALFERLGIQSYELLSAYNQRQSLDVALVVGSYNDVTSKALKAQNEALSAPVARLWDDIFMLPIVGIIDSRRAEGIMQAVLSNVGETQAKVFILDISGVAVVDTAVANHIIKVSKAARLMGCQCIISGITPAVAQTIVELGINTDEISTRGSMKDALSAAYQITGVKF
ncbi:protoglobin domain-containing protein [Saprospira sp. CCB-QB6]|uniref:protoglobin domain-containing protein n=1 Tax=Saprospira sp. CCB-QB6 TaxID=3023936 RepID=UPI00234B9A4F|nr:protoglobin domain-containing protein [Saprospira sp. CCB-QB6]WCL81729.1 protoglobin domain-containing protein [Saprospira sp. CCB-QB6]